MRNRTVARKKMKLFSTFLYLGGVDVVRQAICCTSAVLKVSFSEFINRCKEENAAR